MFAGANGSYGFGLDPTPEAIEKILDEVFVDAGIWIELQLGPQSRMAAIHIAEYIKRKQIGPEACDISFGLDPLGACAAWGASPYTWPEIATAVTGAVKGLAAMGFKGPFAVADGRARVIVVECVVAMAFVLIATAGITGSAWLLAFGLAAHGVKDAWQHRRQFVSGTRWWPPFCAAVDFVVALIIGIEIVAGVHFHSS